MDHFLQKFWLEWRYIQDTRAHYVNLLISLFSIFLQYLISICQQYSNVLTSAIKLQATWFKKPVDTRIVHTALLLHCGHELITLYGELIRLWSKMNEHINCRPYIRVKKILNIQKLHIHEVKAFCNKNRLTQGLTLTALNFGLHEIHAGCPVPINS